MKFMYYLEVSSIEKVYFQADNAEVFEATLDIHSEEGDIVETRKLAFPLSTSEKEMTTEFEKFINNYNAEKQMAEENKERDAMHAEADKTIENLTGTKFSV